MAGQSISFLSKEEYDFVPTGNSNLPLSASQIFSVKALVNVVVNLLGSKFCVVFLPSVWFTYSWDVFTGKEGFMKNVKYTSIYISFSSNSKALIS